MKIELDKSEEVGQWVAKQLGVGAKDFGKYYAIGFTKNESLICGVVYTNFRNFSIDLSIAASSPVWATRTNLFTIFAYPFLDLGCSRITVFQAESNRRARKLAEGVGFRYEGTLRRGWWNQEDAIILGMLKDECRWINLRN